MYIPVALEHRRQRSFHVFDQLAHALRDEGVIEKSFPGLCIFAAGSIARGELTIGSDLDLFLVEQHSEMNEMEKHCVLAALDRARGRSGFREFSYGGRFLVVHRLNTVVEDLGRQSDIANNSFPVRLLCLLESRPLLNSNLLASARTAILDRYWQGSPSKDAPFIPPALIYDIRRFWLTLCLHHEAMRPPPSEGLPGETALGRRRAGDLKLKIPALLTCYSFLIYLLSRATGKGILYADAHDATYLTPVERLLRIADWLPDLSDDIQRALDLYSAHIEYVDCTRSVLSHKLEEDDKYYEAEARASEFHRLIAAILTKLPDKGSMLYDYILA